MKHKKNNWSEVFRSVETQTEGKGIFKDKEGNDVRIVGAYEVVNALRGRDIGTLTKREKIRLGMALHTIQDAVSHKGKRWVSAHKKEAEAIGHKNEHPDFAEVVLEKGSEKAFDLTQAAIEFIQNKGSSDSEDTKDNNETVKKD